MKSVAVAGLGLRRGVANVSVATESGNLQVANLQISTPFSLLGQVWKTGANTWKTQNLNSLKCLVSALRPVYFGFRFCPVYSYQCPRRRYSRFFFQFYGRS